MEEFANGLLAIGGFSPSECLELLRLYARCRLETYKRPLLDDGDPERIALALGVYHHGGRAGVSGPTRDRPGFATYLNKYWLQYCDCAGYARPMWSSIQLPETPISLN